MSLSIANQSRDALGILDELYARLRVGARWANRLWLLALVVLLASLMVAFPHIRHYTDWQPTWQENALSWQIQHPLSPIPVERFARPGHDSVGLSDHLRKRTYRITLPLVAHLLGLGLRGAQIVSAVAALGLVVLLVLHLRRFTRDPAILLLLSLAVSCSYLAQWGINDFFFFDGVGYFLLAAAAYVRQPILIALLLLLAGFSDERAVLAAPLIYLLYAHSPLTRLDLSTLFKPNKAQLGIVAGCFLFLVLRVVFGYLVRRPADVAEISLELFHHNLPFVLPAWLIVYKGSILIMAAGFLSLFTFRISRPAVLVSLALIPGLLASAFVWDLCRSLAYTFPFLLLCTRALVESGDSVTLRRVSLCGAAISLFTPTYEYWEGSLRAFATVFRFL